MLYIYAHVMEAKRMLNTTFKLLIGLFLPGFSFGQLFTFDFTPEAIDVENNGSTLELPWAGGINSAQFFNLDLDQDGIQDIVSFDRSGNKITCFLVRGSGPSVEYVYTEDYQDNFPKLRDWVVAYDYDCDGYSDLFSYMPGGIRVDRNTTGETGEISFEMTTPSNTPENAPLHSLYTDNFVNLYVSSVNIPAFYDVDGDGDMDILTFGSWGTSLHYHRNMSMEKYSHCDSLDFELRNRCWGYFSEGLTSNELTLFDTCDYNVDNPESGIQDDFLSGSGGSRHEGATLCPLDAYGNGLTDLLIADVEYSSITLLENDGTPSHASIVDQDNSFPSYDTPLDLNEFPAAFYLDVDNDGIKDLLASPNQTTMAENKESVWMYKNTGQNDMPDFDFQTRSFLQGEMIDVGEGAIPAFVDINQDDKMDLVISNFRYANATNASDQRFMLLLNVGTSDNPSYRVEDENFLNMSQYGLGNNLAPTFEDLNGDGKPDLIVGDLQGMVHYFENSSSGMNYSFDLVSSPMLDSQNNLIDVGNFAAPHLVDLNRNNKKDLIIGCRNGNIWHYTNTGTPSAPEFTAVTDSLGKLTTALPSRPNNGYSTPVVKEIDGEYRLLVGSLHGNMYQYKNLDGNLGGTFELMTDQTIPFMGTRIYPTLAPLNETEEHTLLVGNIRGGVSAFTQVILEVDFIADGNEFCAGDTVRFTDQSSGVPVAWFWEFEGANVPTSSEQNPTVVFENPGEFSVTLTVSYDGDDISVTKANYVVVNELPEIEMMEPQAMTCASLCDGELAALISGAAPFSYLWSNGQTSTSIDELCEDEYALTVTDSRGCTQQEIYLLESPEIEINYDIETEQANCGAFDGCVEVANLSGGTATPLSIKWEDGAIVTSRCDFYAGLHSFFVVDGNDCEFEQIFEITNPNAPQVEMDVTAVSCEGECDGEVSLSITGGVAPYDYNWGNGLSNHATHSNLCEQFLEVTVVDQDLCQSSPLSDTLSYLYIYPSPFFVASDSLVFLDIDPTVSFDNLSQNATHFDWDFGDGETSGLIAPTHEYTEEGEYTVVLTATNGTCARDFSKMIRVEGTNAVIDQKVLEFNVYPNPAQDAITIKGESVQKIVSVHLLSLSGKVILTREMMGNEIILFDVAHIADGIYILDFNLDSGERVMKKLIIKK